MIGKQFLLSIFLVINPITFVADRNYYVQEAEGAFRRQDYKLASQHYAYLVQDLEWKQEHVTLNWAHACFLAKKYTQAGKQYTAISQSKEPILATIALNQLGYLAAMNQDFEKSLQLFQEAITRYPQNHEARYNYELIAKILRNRGKRKQQDKKRPEKQNNKSKNGKNAPNESAQDSKVNPQKLKDIRLNKEKAESILKAIRNQELQHIQQQQQKKKLNPPTNPNLPDW
jgi:tetratricopeptide (TPR) repeat protein